MPDKLEKNKIIKNAKAVKVDYKEFAKEICAPQEPKILKEAINNLYNALTLKDGTIKEVQLQKEAVATVSQSEVLKALILKSCFGPEKIYNSSDNVETDIILSALENPRFSKEKSKEIINEYVHLLTLSDSTRKKHAYNLNPGTQRLDKKERTLAFLNNTAYSMQKVLLKTLINLPHIDKLAILTASLIPNTSIQPKEVRDEVCDVVENFIESEKGEEEKYYTANAAKTCFRAIADNTNRVFSRKKRADYIYYADKIHKKYVKPLKPMYLRSETEKAAHIFSEAKRPEEEKSQTVTDTAPTLGGGGGNGGGGGGG